MSSKSGFTATTIAYGQRPSFSVAAGSQSAEISVVQEPRLGLTLNSLALLEGQEVLVNQRQGDKWYFVNPDTGELKGHTDRQIIALMAKDRFRVVKFDRSQKNGPMPRSPLIVGHNDANNQRKHAYVQACLNAPGGFRQSRGLLKPIISDLAKARGESKAPGFTTVINWLNEHAKYFDAYGTACFSDRHDLKGKHGHRLSDFQEKALALGVDRYLTRMSAPIAYAAVCRYVQLFDAKFGRQMNKASLGPNVVDEFNRLKPPSLSTLERRLKEVDPIVRDWSRKGPRYAKKKHRTYSTTERPELPYQEVEVDHCKLDILLIDPTGLVFGRPDLVVFRDRATAMIIGYGFGFEEPSYASFLRGLRHAMYPKDLTLCASLQNPWPCFGRIQNLFVDNALHFIGDNIREAGRELGFHVPRFQKREPWLKGGLERFFRSFNLGLVHNTVGTTLQDAKTRSDHEYLGEPALTIDEFEALLLRWICDVYHVEKRRALGPIRGVGDVPLRVWQEKVKTFVTALPPPEEMFIALAGDWELRVIGADGVVWDYIKYEDPILSTITAHPDHRKGMKYKVVRDPMDLGNIYVVNHHRGERIKVPATTGHAQYAIGRTLHQHRVTLTNAKRLVEDWERDHWEAIIRAKDELASITLDLLKRPTRKTVERKVGRFLEWGRGRRARSMIDVPAPADGSGTGYLSFSPSLDASETPVSSFGSYAESVSLDTSDGLPVPPGRPGVSAQNADELERELEAKLMKKNWSATRG